MGCLKLLRARRQGGRQPTMEPIRLTRQQKARAAVGKCIQCGTAKAGANSYICTDCEAKDTIEDIRDELAALRRKILNRPESKAGIRSSRPHRPGNNRTCHWA